MSDITAWLRKHELEKYAEAFAAHVARSKAGNKGEAIVDTKHLRRFG